jgi:NAD(P)-dependent dehydrogenase (short-subunit alcohol dehydrogenase family)
LGIPVTAAIFNLGGGDRKHFKSPFLDVPLSAFQSHWESQVYKSCSNMTLIYSKAAFIFSQALLPLLLSTTSSKTQYPPTLIFTGATAAIKASAHFVSFASAKFGLRALSQSLAKEFGPQGVHVSHVVADGVFDSDRGRSYGGNPEGLMDTNEMAESYWKLHTQGKRAWTWEIDLRPYLVYPERNKLTTSGKVVDTASVNVY